MPTIQDAFALAVQHHQAGRLQAAEQGYRQILAVQPKHAEALHLLGVIAHQVGNHEAAIQCIGSAIRLKGTDPAFHSNMAVALNSLGRWDEAVACYRRALELKPDYAEAHCNLGVALKRLGNLGEAAGCYRRALELKPDLADAHQNLGNLLQDLGQREEAIACYRRVLELKPRSAETYKDLGNALKEAGRYHEAESCCRRALELKPHLAGAHNNLGNALKSQGQVEEAIACYRRALELKPDYRKAHSNLLLALQYRMGITASELAAAHAEFGRRHAERLLPSGRRFENDRDPARRLRIGFLSPDFGRHAVGFFLVRVLEHLDPGQGEVVCYSDRTLQDELTTRLQASARVWRDVAGWADERLTDQILADRIDVLFDLAGHTARNRLAVFARRVAPLQVTWAGYVGTTGLSAMDYLLADRHQIPAGGEADYCESVLRMPDGYVCYDPPSYAGPVSPLPALSQGYVTFGSINNPAKINSAVSELWARILQRVPQSRLVLKYRGMNDPAVRGVLAATFACHGIDPQRLEFLDFSPHAESLAQYQRIDLALDPFPYSGGLTTCEALWMGVPVVTCPGETFASRHSLSHLSNVGLTETIAGNGDEYVESAVALSQDLPRLAGIRSRLRAQMAASPLCDGKRFAENLMRVLRGGWQEWCRKALLGAAVAAAGVFCAGTAAACLPDDNSRIQASADGKYLLVMVSPLPVAEDKGNRPLDPEHRGVRLRDKYRHSGLYRNDGSTEPLWPVPFTDGNLAAQVATDGTCVVFGADPCDLGFHAVTIYANGRHVATHIKRKLIPCYDSKRLLGLLCGWRSVDPIRGVLDPAARQYTLTSEQGEVFVLDISDGRVVRHVSPWRLYVVAFILLVPTGVILIWYRPWIRSLVLRAGRSPPGGNAHGPPPVTWKRFSLRSVGVGMTLLCVALACRNYAVLAGILGVPTVLAGLMTLFFRGRWRSFFIGGVLGCYGCLLGLVLADQLGRHLNSYGTAPSYLVLSALAGGLLLGVVVAGVTERKYAEWERRREATATWREEVLDDAGNAHAV